MKVIAHSRIGASSAERWMACPGSVRLSEKIPSSSSKYAEEGTLAHEAAAILLERTQPRVPISNEMLDHVKVYVDFVEEQAEGKELLIEHKFHLPKIHPDLFGTADAVTYCKKTKTLQVIDFKYGAGIPVEPERNVQLMYYALGAFPHFCDEAKGNWIEIIEIIIVQPRCAHPEGPIRSWKMQTETLLDFSFELHAAAKRTEDPKASLNSGSHCRFCPAAPNCPELHKNALQLAKAEFSPSLSYDPKKLSETLERLPMLEAFIKNVREFAYREAEHGRVPPGFKLVQKRATRKWKNEEEALRGLQQKLQLGAKEICSLTLKSPAQIEKLLPKDQREALRVWVVQESSGFALAPESDRREAARVDAASEFTKIEGE